MEPSLKFVLVGIEAEPNVIYPRLRIQVNVRAENIDAKNNDYISVEGIRLNMSILNERGAEIHLPSAYSEFDYYLVSTMENSVIFHIDLDYFGLSQIEKIRNNKDLRLRGTLYYTLDFPSKYKYKNSASSPLLEYTIPKSTWIEKILSPFKFKDVFLLEIPKVIENDATAKLVEYLMNAQNKLSAGDYEGVLVDCHKALEATKELAKKKGYTTQAEKAEKIDFGKFTEDDTIKEALEKTWASVWSFSQPGGRHIGRERGKEEAWFSILTTYGLVNLLINNMFQQ